jgi:YbbR domain-containing protein
MNKLFRNIFVRNWGLKLFSFILALVIWFTIIPEEKLSFERKLTVSLELHNLPSGLEIMDKPPSTIDVTIKAPNRLFDQINPGTVRAVLELRNARAEQTEFPINRNMILIPQGAEVKEISPSQVRMRLERSREILLDVEANIVGQLAEGLELMSVEVIPAQVSIIGPESKVKDTYKVTTSPIDISALIQTTEVSADLILPDPDLRFSSLESTIRVRIVIAEKGEDENVPEKKKKKITISSLPS